MKQLIVRPIGQFVILASLVCSQLVFAGGPLHGDTDPGSVPNAPAKCNTLSDMTSILVNDITVDIVGTDLIINFNSPIGIATVSIKNSKGVTVYQTTVDTESTADVSLPTSLFSAGNYTVVVSYGSSVYTEQIKL